MVSCGYAEEGAQHKGSDKLVADGLQAGFPAPDTADPVDGTCPGGEAGQEIQPQDAEIQDERRCRRGKAVGQKRGEPQGADGDDGAGQAVVGHVQQPPRNQVRAHQGLIGGRVSRIRQMGRADRQEDEDEEPYPQEHRQETGQGAVQGLGQGIAACPGADDLTEHGFLFPFPGVAQPEGEDREGAQNHALHPAAAQGQAGQVPCGDEGAIHHAPYGGKHQERHSQDAAQEPEGEEGLFHIRP